MSEKKKRHSNHKIKILPFVLLWLLISTLTWILFVLFISLVGNVDIYSFPVWIVVALSLAMIGIPVFLNSFAQANLIRQAFGVKLRGWWLWTTLLTTGAILPGFVLGPPVSVLPILSFVGLAFATLILGQAWILHRYVRHAWLWIIAAISIPVINAIVTFRNSAFDIASFTYSFSVLLQSAVMALTLVWLFGMTRSETAAQNYDTSRLQLKSKHEDENQDMMQLEDRVDELQHHER